MNPIVRYYLQQAGRGYRGGTYNLKLHVLHHLALRWRATPERARDGSASKKNICTTNNDGHPN